MTSVLAAAAMRARTLADGSLRIEVEFEPKDAQAAFALFGRPGSPMAVTALRVGTEAAGAHPAGDDDAAAPNASPDNADRKGGPLARLAGQWCHLPAFQQWIRPVYDQHLGGDGSGWGDLDDAQLQQLGAEGFARHAILVLCQIESRRELDHHPRARKEFDFRVRIPFSRSGQ